MNSKWVFLFHLTIYLYGVGAKLLDELNASDADAVVAQDGAGRYATIMEAVDAAPENSPTRHVIYVKSGLYLEHVTIGESKTNIAMIGDVGAVISGNRNSVDGWELSDTATFAVKGDGFVARDITFENTAGPEKRQAVAFLSSSDLSVLYRCTFRGYQDTVYAHDRRQLYRECTITGSVDFIFGYARSVFQRCNIVVRKGLPGQTSYPVTAQGRTSTVSKSGFVLQFCNISAEDDSLPVYLGRPWKEYSRVVVMESYLSGAVRPDGWLPWNASDFGLEKSYYAEYMNSGPGAGVTGRVKWPGYRGLLDTYMADQFTVAMFIQGGNWLPSTGVRYDPGLGMATNVPTPPSQSGMNFYPYQPLEESPAPWGIPAPPIFYFLLDFCYIVLFVLRIY